LYPHRRPALVADDAQTDLKVKIVRYLARNNLTGGHNRTVDTVKNRAGIPTHAQGDAEETIRELIRNPDAPVEAYGGQRDSIRLTSIADAVEFIENHGGDVPFGLN
jgi:hypothetical protein